MHTHRSRMYLITIPAGACGATVLKALRLLNCIISAFSRWLKKKPYTVDLLACVSDLDANKGYYSAQHRSAKGRPPRKQTIFPGHENIPDPDPHIHIIMSIRPGSYIANQLIKIISQRIPHSARANLQDVSDRWEYSKNYVINQGRYFRVLEKGDPSVLPHGKWQFAEFGRGKRHR